MENSGFVPRETLSQIINEESVAQELERMEQSLKRRLQFWRRPPDTGTIEQEARLVCGNPTSKGAYVHSKPRKCFRKIFAILLLIGQPGAIWEFVNEGICDADLPLSHRLNATGSVASELTRKASPDHSIGCLEDWNTRKRSQLERWQWKVLAPCFSRAEDGKVQHQHFEDKAILPFTYRKRVNSGSHGEIFKIKIHPDHHNFDISLQSNEYFALKIISGEEEEFRQEVRMLKRVHNSHSHLISLFATYQHSSSFHLIMPWAECDLRTYWKVKFPSPSRDDDTALWMARQCEGIAEALYPGLEQRTRVLNPRRGKWTAQERPSYVVFGRHGDIKPSNLLWFPNYQDPEDRGIIKISDLGVGEFSTISTARSTSSSIGHSPMYRPPECDLAGAAITSSYDVWTLGCLYLEFITWYLGGWALLHEFEELRIQATQGLCRTSAFFEIITDVSASGHSQRATVKPIVTQVRNFR
ncbi:kinase-like protein [Thozetella sp. PMI_491]|nr:kinase-like protein [Thozetella sp. PMI_491]